MRITLDPRAAEELASQIEYLIDHHALLAAVRLKARCDAFFEKFLTQHPRTGKHIAERDIWETWIPGTRLVRVVPEARKRRVPEAVSCRRWAGKEHPAGGGQEKRPRLILGDRHGRLACGIWSDFLDEEVTRRMQSPDPGIRRRATWVAEAAISAGKA